MNLKFTEHFNEVTYSEVSSVRIKGDFLFFRKGNIEYNKRLSKISNIQVIDETISDEIIAAQG
jgi:hypothetical protein